MIIEESNLSIAWGKAFLEVFNVPYGEISPLVVVIKDLKNAEPPEIRSIRDVLDSKLKESKKGLSCDEVANTIFPISMWNPDKERQHLFDRYLNIFPRIKKHRRNKYGVYFQRLICFNPDLNSSIRGNNQLEQIISTWKRGNHRRSALQASLFDPHRDLTDQRQRGFPCLQQVAFAKINQNDLQVTGFYATHDIFERAYGNYLGLCRLGRFMAHEMDLNLSRVICIASVARRVVKKGEFEIFAGKIEELLNTIEPNNEDNDLH